MKEADPALRMAEFFKRLGDMATKKALKDKSTPTEAFKKLETRAEKLLKSGVATVDKSGKVLKSDAGVKDRAEDPDIQSFSDGGKKSEELTKAKDWVGNVRSEDQSRRVNALNELKNEQQVYREPDAASRVKLALELRRYSSENKFPDWIKKQVPYIAESQLAAEYVLRVSSLPQDLQRDPYYLYRELHRLEGSIDWQKQTPKSLLELDMVINKSFEEIRRLAVAAKYTEIEHVNSVGAFVGVRKSDGDETYDIGRLNKLSDPERAGDRPSKTASQAEKQSWAKKRIIEEQRDQLNETLKQFQENINRKGVDLKQETDQLRDLERKLTNDVLMTRQVNGVNGYRLDKKDVNPILDRLRVRMNVLKAQIDREQDTERLLAEDKRNERQEIIQRQRRLGEINQEIQREGTGVVWQESIHRKLFPDAKNLRDGDVIRFRSHFPPEDIELLMGPSGYKGQLRWVNKFWADIHTIGKEQARPDIAEMYQVKDVERLIEILHGDSADAIKSAFKSQVDKMGHLSGIIKSLESPGDIKEKAKSLGFFQPDDLHYIFQAFDWSEYSYSLQKEVIMDKINRAAVIRQGHERFLNGEITPEEQALLKKDKKLFDWLTEEAKESGTKITRDIVLDGLQKQYAQFNNEGEITAFGKLSPELYDLMQKIQIARNHTGRATFLMDKDMRFNDAEYMVLLNIHQEHKLIESQLKRGVDEKGVKLDSASEAKLRNQLDVLIVNAGESWKRLTDIPDEQRTIDHYELSQVRGYSPVQNEVRERMKAFLQTKMIKEGKVTTNEEFKEWFKDNEWRVRSAVFGANYASIGFGDVFDITAHIAQAPVLDLSSRVSIGGKDVMPGAYCEPIQRILNPYLFADRFSMGGDFGNAMRNAYYPLAFAAADPDFVRNIPKEYREKIKRAEKYGKPVYKFYIQAAKEYYGMSYTEVLRTNLFKTGTHMTKSTWRPEIGIFEPYIERMMKLKEMRGEEGKNMIIDNQALGLQLSLADPNSPKGVAIREKLFMKMLGRTPSRFFQLMGIELQPILQRHGTSQLSDEWTKFQRALSNAQMSIWDDQEGYNVRQVNLGGKANINDIHAGESKDFDELMRPHLVSAGIINPEQQGKFFDILKDLQKFATESHDGKSSYVERWARHNFPLTLPLADFNMKNAQLNELTAFSSERRIRDMMNMAEVENMFFGFFTPTFMSPSEGMNGLVKNHFEKMVEFKDITSNYDMPDTAEIHLGVIADVFASMNMDRSMYNLIGWIPMSKWIMRNLMEADIRWIDEKIVDKAGKSIPSGFLAKTSHNKLLNKITDGHWEHLAHHPISQWPHTLAGYVSEVSKYGGGESMALNANELGSYFNSLDQRFIFSNNRNIIPNLKRKYGTGVVRRYFYHLPRRFWWVVLAASVSAGVAIASAETQKKGSSH